MGVVNAKVAAEVHDEETILGVPGCDPPAVSFALASESVANEQPGEHSRHGIGAGGGSATISGSGELALLGMLEREAWTVGADASDERTTVDGPGICAIGVPACQPRASPGIGGAASQGLRAAGVPEREPAPGPGAAVPVLSVCSGRSPRGNPRGAEPSGSFPTADRDERMRSGLPRRDALEMSS